MRGLRTVLLVVLLGISIAHAYAAEPKEVVAPMGPGGVQTVEIVGGSYFYDPNHIVVKVNVPVALVVRREPGITPHDIVLRAPEAGIDFEESLDTDPKVIRFTPTKVGTYTFYCSKKFLWMSHRKKGMEGTLEVRE